MHLLKIQISRLLDCRPQVRTLVQQEIIAALSNFDALVSPTAPSTAWKLGEVIDDPLSMYKSDIMTVNLNLAGKTLFASGS